VSGTYYLTALGLYDCGQTVTTSQETWTFSGGTFQAADGVEGFCNDIATLTLQ
jgi:hypothetical protein